MVTPGSQGLGEESIETKPNPQLSYIYTYPTYMFVSLVPTIRTSLTYQLFQEQDIPDYLLISELIVLGRKCVKMFNWVKVNDGRGGR